MSSGQTVSTIEAGTSNGVIAFHGKIRYSKFDAVLEKVGEFGRYQIFTCIIIQCATIMWAGSNTFVSLAMLEPDIRCGNTPNGVNGTDGFISPKDEDYCVVLQNCPGNVTTRNPLFFSPVEEWLLICDKAYIQDLIFGIYLGGRILGTYAMLVRAKHQDTFASPFRVLPWWPPRRLCWTTQRLFRSSVLHSVV